MKTMARRLKTFGGKQTTYPIKDKRDLERLMYYLLNQYQSAKTPIKKMNADRNYMLCLLGFNTAFRAEDLLQLRVIDLKNGVVTIRENKTNKVQNYKMKQALHDDILAYVERNDLLDGDYLFTGQKKMQDGKKYYSPLTRQQAWKIVTAATEAVGIGSKIGIHGMRKTFAYQFLLGGGNMLTLSKMLNHNNVIDTMLYAMWGNEDASKERSNIYIAAVHNKTKKERKRKN